MPMVDAYSDIDLKGEREKREREREEGGGDSVNHRVTGGHDMCTFISHFLESTIL